MPSPSRSCCVVAGVGHRGGVGDERLHARRGSPRASTGAPGRASASRPRGCRGRTRSPRRSRSPGACGRGGRGGRGSRATARARPSRGCRGRAPRRRRSPRGAASAGGASSCPGARARSRRARGSRPPRSARTGATGRASGPSPPPHRPRCPGACSGTSWSSARRGRRRGEGRWKNGLMKVLSTTRTASWRCATAASARMSQIFMRGFVGVSIHRRSDAPPSSNASGSVASRNANSTP